MVSRPAYDFYFHNPMKTQNKPPQTPPQVMAVEVAAMPVDEVHRAVWSMRSVERSC
jgi:hypothetical protein